MSRKIRGTALLLFLISRGYGLPQAPEASAQIGLTVPAGTPLRLYVTKRFSKRTGTPVAAKVLEPVYAFDRQEIPAGAVVIGSVSRTQPVTRWERAQAMLRGDFTPLKISQVEFQSLLLPGGSSLSIRTAETDGLYSIYEEPKKKRPNKPNQNANGGVLGTARQTLQDRVNAQVNGRTQGMIGILRSRDKKEWLYDFAMAKLPYHPQYVRRGTRFDAELRESVSFGSESIAPESAEMLGTQPQADSVVSVRLLTPVDSGSARQGDRIEAVLTAPLFAPGQKLVLPEGTRLKGAVSMTRRARWFHRGGQLRFNFLDVELPPEAAGLHFNRPASLHHQAVLEAAEGSGPAPTKVDSEGTVKAAEPKSRLLAPVLSAVVASRAADNDAGRIGAGAASHGAGGNVGGRTLGGGLGFGLVGSAIAQSSRYVGMAFGYYGLAWSVYSNVIARGAEVSFAKNAVLQVKFGGRPAGGDSVAKEIPK
ncbi:MAG: hypothetical protein ACLQVN_16005 [Bryobacteraceae bacterium]